MISVYWQPEQDYYPGMVLSYNRRSRTHKLLYFEDETIEVLELGTGPEQRPWKVGPPMPDPLVGKEIALSRQEGEDVDWFDFMRASREKKEGDLVVLVLSRLPSPQEEDEISHPLPTGWNDESAPHKFYRIIYVANEFLATVDLEYVKYKVLGEDEGEEGEEEGSTSLPRARSELTPGSRKLLSRANVTDDDEGESAEKDDPYVPPEDIGEDDGDENAEDDEKDIEVGVEHTGMDGDDNGGLKRNLNKVAHTSTRIHAAAGGDNIDEDVRGKDLLRKTITADRGEAYVDRDPSNVFVDSHGNVVELKADAIIRTLADDDDDIEQEMPMRSKGEGSVATQETHDDPLEPNGASKRGEKGKTSRPTLESYTKLFDEEEDGHTASDEEKLGWVSARKEQPTGSKSQVGDYISLKMGVGKLNRKAFVEAYMPDADKHFLAFCDAEGGNLQIKLTEHNHTVLKDEEVDELNRAQSLDIRDERQNLPMKSNKRRRLAVNLADLKTKRSRDVKPPPIRGERAGDEICGRCLKIVWPGSDMVYTALVLGYDKERDEHQVVYLSDQCVETMELKYREWNLLPRDDEPWISQGMLGKRLYIYWIGEYAFAEDQKRAKEIFGDEVKVPFEAYVLSYEGDGKYMIIYPNSEDREVRDLKTDGMEDIDEQHREWGLLKPGQMQVNGLPVIGWEP